MTASPGFFAVLAIFYAASYLLPRRRMPSFAPACWHAVDHWKKGRDRSRTTLATPFIREHALARAHRAAAPLRAAQTPAACHSTQRCALPPPPFWRRQRRAAGAWPLRYAPGARAGHTITWAFSLRHLAIRHRVGLCNMRDR